MTFCRIGFGTACLALLATVAGAEPLPYPWKRAPDAAQSLERRIEAPQGFTRRPVAAESFGEWLRGLPLKPGRPPVRLYDGRLKGNQNAHWAVLDIDVGKRDLQQCADAVMRLRAEYLFAQGRRDDIAFNFTSGDRAAFSKWADGDRPQVVGNKVSWKHSAAPDRSYESFRRYLDTVFNYAGSASLARELTAVPDVRDIELGDVFIQGGSPGHAVLVVDVAERGKERVFLIAQSYMPAQEIHVLRNPANDGDPWYSADFGSKLVTPEWVFARNALRRFRSSDIRP